MREDEELAHEFLLGNPGAKGRTYPNRKREAAARAALARIMMKEAPNGYFTRLVAAHIDPPRDSSFITRRIVFQQSRGRPFIGTDRRDVEVAAFMHAELKKQKDKGAATEAQSRNLKPAIHSAMVKFGLSGSAIKKIWARFAPKPRKSKYK